MKTFKNFLAELDTGLDYHDELNPVFWEGGRLKSHVRDALLKITREFSEFLEIRDTDLADVVLTGSNANYNWTRLSDLDLHLIANVEQPCRACAGVDFDSCMRAKKSLWNDGHNISIHGFPVEVYVEPKTERTVGSAGVYSLLTNQWIKEPTREIVDLTDPSIVAKAKTVMDEIDNVINNVVDDTRVLKDLKTRIRLMRAAGLEKGGEFSIENLAFKTLRNNGYVDRLSKYLTDLEDKQLSVE